MRIFALRIFRYIIINNFAKKINRAGLGWEKNLPGRAGMARPRAGPLFFWPVQGLDGKQRYSMKFRNYNLIYLN